MPCKQNVGYGTVGATQSSHNRETRANVYGERRFTAPPPFCSRTHPGSSGCFGLWVSQCYKCGPSLSHPALRNALSTALSDPIVGLYTDNASAPLNAHTGLRRVYKFGLYSHCAYTNKTSGLCTSLTFAYQFQPYAVITSDMRSNYSDITDAIIRNSTFANSLSLGRSSRAAYYLLLFGLILSTISMLTSV